MSADKRAADVDRIAGEALGVLGSGQQVATISSRYPGFDLGQAYDVAAKVRDMRTARGENAVGRKIGFTNRTIWDGYGISGPIWNYMFDATVTDLTTAAGRFALAGIPEPRIEPEIALHLARTPHADMSEDELVGCIDWIAHGFEIVHSIFPGWRFTAADAVAACGLHSALLLGKRQVIIGNPRYWMERLSSFTIALTSDEGIIRHGHARNVLGGPLKALRVLVDDLARDPAREPLRPGELVTTGTLTEAMPVVAGQSWSTDLAGIDLQGLRLRFD